MDLPLELQLGILKYLNKRDHKVVRLVNKDWSAITSGFLFDRIYWSPQDRDLEVFKAIATHPELAQCVKELIFDGSQFVDGLTKRTYLEALCSQHDLVDHRAEFVKGGPAWKSPAFKEVNLMFVAVYDEIQSTRRRRGGHPNSGTLYDNVLNSKFVTKGYSKWIECAKKQRNYMDDPELRRLFHSGLASFHKLESVMLSPSWSDFPDIQRNEHGSSDLSMARCTGSPLARSWSILHAKPFSWRPDDDGRNQFDGAAEFFYLSTSLSATGKRPCKLSIGLVDNSKDILIYDGTPRPGGRGAPTSPKTGLPAIFNNNFACSEMHHIYVNAYQALTHLTLHMLCSTQDADALHSSYSLCGLGRLLKSIPKLEYLELVLPNAWTYKEHPYRYDHLFVNKDGRWPHLHTLVLEGIAIGIKDLMEFFCKCLPNLRSLSFSSILLLDGRWELIVEGMRRSLKLKSMVFRLDEGLFLYTHGVDSDPMAEYDWDLDVLRDYVLRRPGVRHPNLPEYNEATSDKDGEDVEGTVAENGEESKSEKKKRREKREKDRIALGARVSQQYFDELQKYLLQSA